MSVTQTQHLIIHDFEGITATERRRTTSKGTKSRVTIEFRSEPLVANLDPVAIGKPVAEAMSAAIRQGIRDIGELAKPSTIRRRESAGRALARGESWATRRYAGGRTGSKPPNQTSRLFNDSGRLADGIFTRANAEGEYTINVPANRFDPLTFTGGMAAVTVMIQRLRSLVPVLQSAEKLFQVPAVAKAAREAIGNVLQRQGDATRARLRAAIGELGRNVQELGEAAGGLAGDEG